MKKEWSIKKEICSGKLGQDCVYMAGIELLRKKLIEDIQALTNKEMHPSRKLMVARIINKRFGV